MTRPALILALLLCGCSPDIAAHRIGSAEAGEAPRLTGQPWALRELQGHRVPRRTNGGKGARTAATLHFARDGYVSGTWSCNSVSQGDLRWTGVPGEPFGGLNRDGKYTSIITAAGCGNTRAELMATRFWGLMLSARTWTIVQERHGSHLRIDFVDGTSARLVPIAKTPGA